MHVFHILPIGDSHPHISSSSCECCPKCIQQVDGSWLIIHQAYDNRPEHGQSLEEIVQEVLDGNVH